MRYIKRTLPFFLLLLALTGCSQSVAPSAANTSVPLASPSLSPHPTLLPTLSDAEIENPTATAEPSASAETSASTEPTAEPVVPVSGSEPTPTAMTPPDQPPPTASDCLDVAAFWDDVTVPDDTPFKQSVDFEKVWRIRNEGTCTWQGYQLVWAGGNVFDAPLANPVSDTAPGELVDIRVPMRSPNQGGVFSSYWEFENPAGKRFGVNAEGIDLIWVRISVSWYPEGETRPGASPLPTPSGGCNVEENPAYVEQLLALINDTRQQNGLPTLALDARLSAAAQAHSVDMACQDFVDHTGSNGSRWNERIKAAGYSFSYATENIYVGNPAFGGDAQGAFDWWMNSEIHRNNILSTKVTQIGIGYTYNASSTYKGYYTLKFARP